MASKIDRTRLNSKLKEESGIVKRRAADLTVLHALRADIEDCFEKIFTEITGSLDKELDVLASALKIYAKSEA